MYSLRRTWTSSANEFRRAIAEDQAVRLASPEECLG
jgi:hypothetical protein